MNTFTTTSTTTNARRRRSSNQRPFFAATSLSLLLLLVVHALFLSASATAASAASEDQLAAARRMIKALSSFVEGEESSSNDLNAAGVVEDAKLLFGEEALPLQELQTEEETEEEEEIEEDSNEEIFYADRHVETMLDIVSDPDCMTGDVTFTVSTDGDETEDYIATIDRAVQVLSKCGLAVIRNAVSKPILEAFKQNVTRYMFGLQDGSINPEGTTTYGEQYFIHEVSQNRYDICFTPDLLNEDILGNELLLNIVQDIRVLGEDISLLDFGAVLSQPGASYQHWHEDGDIYPNLFEAKGLAGMDLPPFAIGVMTPLLNVTAAHGPTEFCLGTNAIARIYREGEEMPHFQNETLEEVFINVMSYIEERACPPSFFRAPELNFGDIALFHYNTRHRGGENSSPDLRVVLYNTYALDWYKDNNFMNLDGQYGSDEFFRELFKYARIGMPHKNSDDSSTTTATTTAQYEQDALERGTFRPKGGKKSSNKYEVGVEVDILISNVDVELDNLQVCYEAPNTTTTTKTAKTTSYSGETDNTNDYACFEAPDIGTDIIMEVTTGGRISVVQGESETAPLKTWYLKGPDQILIKHQFLTFGSSSSRNTDDATAASADVNANTDDKEKEEAAASPKKEETVCLNQPQEES